MELTRLKKLNYNTSFLFEQSLDISKLSPDTKLNFDWRIKFSYAWKREVRRNFLNKVTLPSFQLLLSCRVENKCVNKTLRLYYINFNKAIVKLSFFKYPLTYVRLYYLFLKLNTLFNNFFLLTTFKVSKELLLLFLKEDTFLKKNWISLTMVNYARFAARLL